MIYTAKQVDKWKEEGYADFEIVNGLAEQREDKSRWQVMDCLAKDAYIEHKDTNLYLGVNQI